MIDANRIADALGRPRPTSQQRAVIESPLAPALVVAGAGSGKTETMANRVLWLLANRHVAPSEILGLTFTRKAAAELAARIRERIESLAVAGLLGDGFDPFDAPTVATYNSYANSLFRDNAAVLGRDGDGALLGDAAAWQLARATVVRSKIPGLAGLGKSLDSITKATLSLSRALTENVASPADVQDFARRFAAVSDLPTGGRGAYAAVDEWSNNVGFLEVLVALAEEYAAAKLERALVEYSDQVAFALQILSRQPRVGAGERQRFRVVLLDEYQDTSVVQSRLLAQLFAGHTVMAVGDPNQSIYGWRGASASNLDDFASTFGATGATYALTTSWRNGRKILDAANVLVGRAEGRSLVTVPTLEASPTASDRAIEVSFAQTVVEEAEAVALWLKKQLKGAHRSDSAAMLFRSRKAQRFFLAALRKHGVPFHVLGVGGLLAEPEIVDLVCALSVVADSSAGIELVRLLAGSRWRIGVQDLWELHQLASWLRDRDYAHQRYAEELSEAMRASVANGEGGSIVDALDFIGTASDHHGALARFSSDGRSRLRDAARFIARLRSRASLELPDLVAVAMHELCLDIEVASNEFRPIGAATFEAFFDAVTSFLALGDAATLAGFLSWLRQAEQREDLSPRPEDPEPGTVQVLTIHGSKGLEWDHVVVPRMVEGELPGMPVGAGYLGWLTFGELPWQFRGDSAELPVFDWEDATTRKDLVELQKTFKDRVREHLLAEERRLAYVAVTRARHGLLLSGSFWATQSKPRLPSRFLVELGVELPGAPDASENPLGTSLERIVWPQDPLGNRRPSVEAAADAVRRADPRVVGPWAADITLLLEERRARAGAHDRVTMPIRIPASRFKDFVTAPAEAASMISRPMPQKPFRATQLGNLFHSWVEGRYAAGGDSAELDSLPGEDDESDLVTLHDLDRLKEVFEASPWADRRPVDVEREIHLPFDGQIVVCKIDAVYAVGDRFEVVDWKTGDVPKDAADLEHKQLQLALYRLAYAKWRGIDPVLIDAAFYFVAHDEVIRPERLFDEPELLHRWQQAFR